MRHPGRGARAVIGLVATGATLSACTGGLQPAAAVVGGHRISQAALQEELHVFLTNPQVAQEVQATGDAARKKYTRQALFFLIQVEVVRQYARAHGIAVARAEIDRQLAQAIQQLGGRGRFQLELRRRRLSLSEVRTNIQQTLLLSKTEDAIGGPALANDQQQKNAAFAKWFERRVAAQDVRVNPRFGRLDPSQGAIVPVTSTQA